MDQHYAVLNLFQDEPQGVPPTEEPVSGLVHMGTNLGINKHSVSKDCVGHSREVPSLALCRPFPGSAQFGIV